MNYSTMKELWHAKVKNFGPVAENAKVIDPQEQIQNEKQKFCMWLVNSNADIDDELNELLNMSDAFFAEMKNAEEKKFKEFCEWSESDNFDAELEHCLSKKCHTDTKLRGGAKAGRRHKKRKNPLLTVKWEKRRKLSQRKDQIERRRSGEVKKIRSVAYRAVQCTIDDFDERQYDRFETEKLVACEYNDCLLMETEKREYPSICCELGQFSNGFKAMTDFVVPELKNMITREDQYSKCFEKNAVAINTQMSYASIGLDAKPHDDKEDSKKSAERKREQKK